MTATRAEEWRRFEFGANWRRFLSVLTPARITQATRSLQEMLGVRDLQGKRFVDVGSGSGLFSLAARQLGAEVHSFDFDRESVACTAHLRDRYFAGDRNWVISHGSILDDNFVSSLGVFDVVYSWGVLHHTGEMWTALENATRLVAPGGSLFIALYNDQGLKSRMWLGVKRLYVHLPKSLQIIYLAAFGCAFEIGAVAVALGTGRPGRIVERWSCYQNVRGMSRWHDVVDWVGGYPFEVASPDAVIEFCCKRHLVPVRLNTCGGKMGCNEFVFERAT